MKLEAIEKKSGLTKAEFENEYLKKSKPVVFTDLIKDWPAKDKWTFDFLIKNYGHISVPIYDGNYSKAGKGYMTACGEMKFGDYLHLIQEGPTDKRIFLFNLFKHAPELRNDIRIPEITEGFFNEFPFMFFGGQGSYTKIHYDIDCSHVFLTQFQTRKRIVLFDQSQSKKLQALPFTVTCLVDPMYPDENKFPSIKSLEGMETILNHGETVFIPSQYWHHIEYTDGGFSIALRANNSIPLKLKGAFNIARHFVVDKSMNLILGEHWMNVKKQIAQRRANIG